MKKYIVVLLLALFVVAGCGSEPKDDPGQISSDIDKIKISSEVQDLTNQEGETKIVIRVDNTSGKIFNGNINVVSKGVDGSNLANKTVKVIELMPGTSVAGEAWLKVSNPPDIKCNVAIGALR